MSAIWQSFMLENPTSKQLLVQNTKLQFQVERHKSYNTHHTKEKNWFTESNGGGERKPSVNLENKEKDSMALMLYMYLFKGFI